MVGARLSACPNSFHRCWGALDCCQTPQRGLSLRGCYVLLRTPTAIPRPDDRVDRYLVFRFVPPVHARSPSSESGTSYAFSNLRFHVTFLRAVQRRSTPPVESVRCIAVLGILGADESYLWLRHRYCLGHPHSLAGRALGQGVPKGNSGCPARLDMVRSLLAIHVLSDR